MSQTAELTETGLPRWLQRVLDAWWVLTGFHTFRSWHSNTWRDSKRDSDWTLVLLWVCAIVALSAWWQVLHSAGGDLGGAFLAFLVVWTVVWYGWMIPTTILRDRRRLLLRMTIKGTSAANKSETLRPRRGSIRFGRAQGLHRGVVWIPWSAYPERLHALYPPALIDDSNPTERLEVERAILAELHGLDEEETGRTKRGVRYRVSWQPSANQLTVSRVESVPDYVRASEETVTAGGIFLGYTADGGAVFAPEAHTLIMGETGAGKSGSVAGWIAGAARSGIYSDSFIIDMKGDGDYGSFAGREGINMVATEPHQIAQVFREVEAIIAPRARARQAASESHGEIPIPKFGEVLVVMDEAQELVDDYGDEIIRWVKKYRSVGLRLVYITQRADVGKAIPGAGARDQFRYRIALGPLSEAGAEMLFGTESPLYDEVQGIERVPGRFLARIDGDRVYGQAPFLDKDAEPWTRELYPPLRRPRPAGTGSITPGLVEATKAPETGLEASQAPETGPEASQAPETGQTVEDEDF